MVAPPPPFAGLRTLEAAARLRSYSGAGEELGVTHSAVSQTVRRLELTHGHKLFLRQGSQMVPTPAALALAEAYREAASIVERTTDRLSRASAAPALVLSTLPSFAKLWFSPRLKRLQEALPDILIDVRTTRDLANLETDGIDVAIRIGGGPWPRLHAETLYEDAAFVACSPEFLARHGPFTDQRIAEAPLIREDDDMWSAWFEAAGVAPPATRGGLAFDDAAMVLEAAASGLGVALVRRAYAQSALEGGRLVRISDVEARDGRSCHMLWREDNPRIAAIYRFADWLLSECQNSGLLEAA